MNYKLKIETKWLTLVGAVLMVMSSCVQNGSDASSVRGYKPVYAAATFAKTTEVTSARATITPGKIYVYNGLLFQIDQGIGIHVIDNSTAAQGKKIAFLSVPGATELAVKSGFLYTNNLDDLVVFDLSNPAKPTLVRRVEKAFPVINQDYPPLTNVYFECPDPSKGLVIDWTETILDNPTCRR